MPDEKKSQPECSAIRSRRSILLFILIFSCALAADLALKAWAMKHLPSGDRSFIPYLLSFRWQENHGAIFGIMQGMRWFFIAASVVATAVILFLFAQSRSREWGMHIGLSLILAGAMGNLYDRIVHGFVRDMLFLLPETKLPFGWTWSGGIDSIYPWIFNLADVFLLFGIGMVLIGSLLTIHPQKKQDGDPSENQAANQN